MLLNKRADSSEEEAAFAVLGREGIRGLGWPDGVDDGIGPRSVMFADTEAENPLDVDGRLRAPTDDIGRKRCMNFFWQPAGVEEKGGMGTGDEADLSFSTILVWLVRP
jgi:hypothetical protein